MFSFSYITYTCRASLRGKASSLHCDSSKKQHKASATITATYIHFMELSLSHAACVGGALSLVHDIHNRRANQAHQADNDPDCRKPYGYSDHSRAYSKNN